MLWAICWNLFLNKTGAFFFYIAFLFFFLFLVRCTFTISLNQKQEGFSFLFSSLWSDSKSTLCLFCPLSQSAISSFDLLFTWLSVCIARIFILRFNVWWERLWSRACCSGVTLANSCLRLLLGLKFCVNYSIAKLKIRICHDFFLFCSPYHPQKNGKAPGFLTSLSVCVIPNTISF